MIAMTIDENTVEKDSSVAPIHKVGKPGDRREVLFLSNKQECK